MGLFELADGQFIKVLLVEDDEDDFILTRDVCDRTRGWRFEVDLAIQLRQRNPTLKVIFTSGYSAGVVGNDLEGSGNYFLQKPYRQPHSLNWCVSVSTAPDPKLCSRSLRASLPRGRSPDDSPSVKGSTLS